MRIKLYQINPDRDIEDVIFTPYEKLEKSQGGEAKVQSRIYDCVFDGIVNCSDLEGVFRVMNMNMPEGYEGRFMAVSDVVEVVDSGEVEKGFYYCNTFGYSKIDFEPERTQPVKSRTMKVVMVEPGRTARVAEIGTELKDLQDAVGGYIETVYPFDEDSCIVCNDEGKILGLPLNRALHDPCVITEMGYKEMTEMFREAERNDTHMTGYVVFSQDSFDLPYSEASRTYEISSNNKAFKEGQCGYSIFASSLDGSDRNVRLERYMANEYGGENGWKIEKCYTKEGGDRIADIIAGTFFICDCSGENFASLSDDRLEKYTELFKYPESFYKVNGEIKAVQYNPRETVREL